MISITKLAIYGFFILFIFGIVDVTEAAEQSWITAANNDQMSDSGFDIVANHKYIIQTTGKWSCGPHPWDDTVCGYTDANGDYRYAWDTLYPKERVSAIVFIVGPNKIGSGTNIIFTASQSGRLYSVFNDVPGMFDNAGSVTSSIEDITQTQTPVVTINKDEQISPTVLPPIATSSTASVNLYGEKTDVELGDDILLRLSAVNYITKPKMTVQVIIIPPSGMSVISTEFAKTQAGQYTTNYELQPGDGKDIEVKIVPNQVGDFKVTGKIVYYFGDDKEHGEYHDLDLPIKVRSKGSNILFEDQPKKDPGFDIMFSIWSFLLIVLFLRREKKMMNNQKLSKTVYNNQKTKVSALKNI